MITKENKTTKETGEIIPNLFDIASIKTIYIVKYKEVYHMPDSSATKANTYNLFTFEDLEMAKEYMNMSYNLIVLPHIVNGDFSILFETVKTETGKGVILEKLVKMIGVNDKHKSQTKLFTFSIEEIGFKNK